MALREDLLSNMNAHVKSWKTMGGVYGFLSVAFRMLIIVGSAVVASDALKNYIDKTNTYTVPLISLIVAVCASLEAWVKPRDKWKGFMDVREHCQDIIRRVDSTADDASDVSALNEEFIALRDKHLKENVF